jgi:hypothetical protein
VWPYVPIARSCGGGVWRPLVVFAGCNECQVIIGTPTGIYATFGELLPWGVGWKVSPVLGGGMPFVAEGASRKWGCVVGESERVDGGRGGWR